MMLVARRAIVHRAARPYDRGHHIGDIRSTEPEITRSGMVEQDRTRRGDEELEEIREHARRYPFTTTFAPPGWNIVRGSIPNLADDECEHGKLPTDRGEPCSCWARGPVSRIPFRLERLDLPTPNTTNGHGL